MGAHSVECAPTLPPHDRAFWSAPVMSVFPFAEQNSSYGVVSRWQTAPETMPSEEHPGPSNVPVGIDSLRLPETRS